VKFLTMLKFKLLLTLALLPFFLSAQQTQETSILVSPENSWTSNYFHVFTGTTSSRQYVFKDSVELFEGKEYHRLLYSQEEMGGDWQDGRLYRQEDSKIYTVSEEEEYLYYDFGIAVGDTFSNQMPGHDRAAFEVMEIDSIVMLDNSKRKRLKMRCLDDPTGSWYGIREWVEGIGDLWGLSSQEFACLTDSEELLACFSISGELLYQRFDDKDCWLFNAVLDISNDQLNIYPNPSSDLVTIKTELDVDNIEIFTQAGTSLFKIDFQKQFSIQGLANGFYVVVLTDRAGNTIVRKLMKY